MIFRLAGRVECSVADSGNLEITYRTTALEQKLGIEPSTFQLDLSQAMSSIVHYLCNKYRWITDTLRYPRRNQSG